jgi:ribonucleoside-diphosphate reductase alpha chain
MSNTIDFINDIKIDYSRDNLFSESGLERLKEGYMQEGETSPQHRFAFISKIFGSNLQHAQRLYDYSSKMWLSFASPILSYNNSSRSLPISCFGSFLDDSMESILETSSETRMLAVVGGGVGLHVNLRPGDRKSSGIIPHLKTYDVDTLAFKQGTTRRGATAAYLDINHPEIIEFLEMRKPTGGDSNRKCLNIHHGVNITDDFMRRVEALSLNGSNLSQQEKEELDKFPLLNPFDKSVVDYASVKELWERIITIRMETGEPYLWFIDTVNRYFPEYQQKLGLKSNGSNLCSEITLATNNERTFVCCLSSVNLEYYDDWKDNKDFIPDIVEMLDNVLEVFIQKGKKFLELKRAIVSAISERSIGIGALGWHNLLMKKKIPFESAIASGLNRNIWKNIHTQAKDKTTQLGKDRGACPDSILSDFPVRNSHLFAIAPNASSSIILNTSPSVEPLRANVYLEKGINGTRVHRNKYLEKLLDEKGKNIEEVWSEIIANDGSVSELNFLDEYEKKIFKTAMEIDQAWIIQHAADRQPYVCQAQSINLFFVPTANIEYVHLVHLMAWKQGLKSLYYCRSENIKKADLVGKKIAREKIEDLKDMLKDDSSCIACEG